MTSRRLFAACLAVLLTLGGAMLAAPDARAHHGVGGEDGGGDDDTVVSEADSTTEVTSASEATRDHVTVSPVRVDPPCAKYVWVRVRIPVDDPTDPPDDADDGDDGDDPIFNPDLYDPPPDDTTYIEYDQRTDVCAVYWDCRGERIDEILTGELSSESEKRYAEYVYALGALVEGFVPFGDWDIDDPETFGSLAEALAEGGLGPRPEPQRMPIFYYCLYGTDGPLYTGFTPGLDIDEGGTTYFPDFDWDTEVNTEYDLATARETIFLEARAVLQGEDMEMSAIPPLDQGHTYVKFPMWLWLENPIEDYIVNAYSDPATVRVSIAAVFNRIEWNMNGELVTCDLDDMRAYEGGDPTVDKPECHHVFDDLVDEFDLTAEVYYDVYERVSYRGSEAYPWPNNIFYVHPTDPVMVVDQDGPSLGVHELISLNVNERQGD